MAPTDGDASATGVVRGSRVLSLASEPSSRIYCARLLGEAFGVVPRSLGSCHVQVPRLSGCRSSWRARPWPEEASLLLSRSTVWFRAK